jgi:hypothetical protein
MLYLLPLLALALSVAFTVFIQRRNHRTFRSYHTAISGLQKLNGLNRKSRRAMGQRSN